MVLTTCKVSTQDIEAGSEVQVHHRSHRQCEASLQYVSLSLKKMPLGQHCTDVSQIRLRKNGIYGVP